MKKGKILPLCALVVILLCGAAGAGELQSMTGSGQCGENITWNLDTAGNLTITGTGDFYGENSENYLPWREFERYIVDVTISDGIATVPDYAFQNCDYLESVTLGKDVKSIGEQAFRECVRLTDIDLNAVESVGEAAFAYCTELKTVDLRHVSEISPGAFYNCPSLYSVQFSDTIEIISESAFAQTGIMSLIIPGNIKEIEEGAFLNCENLERIEIGSGLTYIDRIFSYCRSVKTVIIPVSVTAIDQNTFDNCDISDVYYAGTAEQWDKIRGGGADNLMYRAWRIHFESTGPENAAPMTFQIRDVTFEESRVRFSISTAMNGTQMLRFIVSYYDEKGRFIDCGSNSVFLPRDAGEWDLWMGDIDVEKASTAKIIFLDENLRIATSVSGTVKHWS